MNQSLRKGLLAVAALCAIGLAGCNDKSAPSAPPPQPSLPPQVMQYDCPVRSGIEMQNIFRGYYGVDALSRPVNASHIPVDLDGNCLSTAPVDVFMAPLAPLYATAYYNRYHSYYSYDPGFVHIIVVPGSSYRQGIAPTGRVIVQTTLPPGKTAAPPVAVTTSGASGTMKPGAPAAASPAVNSTGAAGTMKPGAPAPAATAAPTPAPSSVTPPAPSSVTPPAPSATNQSSPLNRPTAATPAAPAPAAQPPASVMPPKAAAPAAASPLNRPTAAPSVVIPPKSSGSSSASPLSRPKR